MAKSAPTMPTEESSIIEIDVYMLYAVDRMRELDASMEAWLNRVQRAKKLRDGKVVANGPSED